MDAQEIILEGLASVKAAISTGNRDVQILFIDKKRDDKGTRYLVRIAGDKRIRVEKKSREELDALAEGSTHGGVLAVVGERRFTELHSMITSADRPFIAMLDGIEDPYNFGFAVRALYAAGADGLVVRPRNWMSAAKIVARSSAGASEYLPTSIVETPDEAASFFAKHGLTIAVTAKNEKSISLYQADLSAPLFLLIGGERRGVQRSFLESADLLLEIPYARDFRQSLGAASASSIIAFEVMRQRMIC